MTPGSSPTAPRRRRGYALGPSAARRRNHLPALPPAADAGDHVRALALLRRRAWLRVRARWRSPRGSRAAGCCCTGTSRSSAPWRMLGRRAMTAVVKRISFLGSTIAVLTLGTLLAAVSWRRCRAVATVVLIATFGRPLLEFTIKAIVDRDRPDLERLVNGTGPSFPSGHVMAAAALWGLAPLVVTLYTRNRRIWWATTIASALVDPGHRRQPHVPRRALAVRRRRRLHRRCLLPSWGAEWLLARQHRRRPCAAVHVQRNS